MSVLPENKMETVTPPAHDVGGVTRPYIGRFAPSPTGPLHEGSLISALASYLDAKAHGGDWLIRIEDIDGPRTVPGAADTIIETLHAYGMHADRPIVWQSTRFEAYQQAFDALIAAGRVYPCGCTRREIADSLVHAQAAHTRNATLAYPGTCRTGLQGRTARAWRLRVPDDSVEVRFIDRWQGIQCQNLALEVGDFALKRADGLWAYQLAVVIDDAQAGITDIVRGADLLDSTPRQIFLQSCLGLPTPRYLHIPVLNNDVGEKLSKQNGAQALSLQPSEILNTLNRAAAFLGLNIEGREQADFYRLAIAAWQARGFTSPSLTSPLLHKSA